MTSLSCRDRTVAKAATEKSVLLHRVLPRPGWTTSPLQLLLLEILDYIQAHILLSNPMPVLLLFVSYIPFRLLRNTKCNSDAAPLTKDHKLSLKPSEEQNNHLATLLLWPVCVRVYVFVRVSLFVYIIIYCFLFYSVL